MYRDLIDFNHLITTISVTLCLLIVCPALAVEKFDCQKALELDAHTQMITLPNQMELEIRYTFDGIEKSIRGHQQDEMEKKLNIPTWPIEYLRFDQRRDDFRPATISSMEELISHLINAHFGQIGEFINFKALGVNSAHWHGPRYIGETTVGIQTGDFIVKLGATKTAHGTEMGEDWNKYKNQYYVGKQLEIATYFDTPAGDLAQKGFALRSKGWHQENDPSKPVVESLFLKKQRPYSITERLALKWKGSEELFGRRLETQVPLSGSFNLSERSLIMSQMLRAQGVPDEIIAQVRPVKIVRNIRYGIDMYYFGWKIGQPRKVGFVTFDEFTTSNLDASGNTIQTTNPTRQLEFEVLPEETDLVQTHPDLFKYFMNGVRDFVHGQFTDTPKYLQENPQ